MNLEYNTQRPHLTLREYGRNVQNLVSHIKSLDDKEQRNKLAAVLVELMKTVNPEFSKDAAEYNQKVWDDLFIISKFDLDVVSPYPIPESTILDKKPERMKYQLNNIKYKHYGRNLEVLIQNAIKLEDPKEREGAIIVIGKLMKSFYLNWNKDNIEDEGILKNLRAMSDGKLEIDIAKVKEYGLFDLDKRAYDGPNSISNTGLPAGGNNNRNRNFKHRNNKNGKRNFKPRRNNP